MVRSSRSRRDRHRRAAVHVRGRHHVERLLRDLDEARRAAEARDAVHAVDVDLGGRVHVVGVGAALVERVVPQRHEHRALRVGVHPAQVAAREDRQRELVHVLGLGHAGAVGPPFRDQVCRSRRSSAVIWSAQLGRSESLIVDLLMSWVVSPRRRCRSGGCRSRSRTAAAPCSGRTARACSGACRGRRCGWSRASRGSPARPTA